MNIQKEITVWTAAKSLDLKLKIAKQKNGIRYAMNKLKNRGLLEREGATKKGKWSINLCEKDSVK